MKVWNFKEPTISSYSVIEDRNNMEEPLIFDEQNVNFFLTFIDFGANPKYLDPRIGELKVS